MGRLLAAFGSSCLLLAAGCATSSGNGGSGRVMQLGEQFETPQGRLYVLRVQDEYRVIRSTQEGPIRGFYEDVFSVPADSVKFNRWLDVQGMPGVQMALLSPTQVAFRVVPEGGSPR